MLFSFKKSETFISLILHNFRLAKGYIDSFSNKKSKTDSDSSENEVDYHDSNSISDRLMKDRLKQQKKLHR
jgi:hypothetical protein